ncbi:MAG: hypothetical protein E7289_06410 [Lachnospiraceae bacterium]|nr:hypothetical protein [Lachnospiraceae bacterium]
MSSRSTIEFNFTKAKQQADKLDAIANDLSRMSSSDFAGIMQNVSANWKGENASAYLAKGSTLQGKMDVTAKSLRGVAADIRAAAKRIYDAEMLALSIAESRTYHT